MKHFLLKGLISVEGFLLEAFFGVGEVLSSKNLRCTTWGETVQSNKKPIERGTRWSCVIFLVLRFQNLRFLLICDPLTVPWNKGKNTYSCWAAISPRGLQTWRCLSWSSYPRSSKVSCYLAVNVGWSVGVEVGLGGRICFDGKNSVEEEVNREKVKRQ